LGFACIIICGGFLGARLAFAIPSEKGLWHNGKSITANYGAAGIPFSALGCGKCVLGDARNAKWSSELRGTIEYLESAPWYFFQKFLSFDPSFKTENFVCTHI
jgi:hypothetical protein